MHSEHAAFVVVATFLFVVALGAAAVIGQVAMLIDHIAP